VTAPSTRRGLGRAHVPPTKLFRRLAVNKTVVKPSVAAATGANTYRPRWDFPDVIKFRVAAHTISEKATRFRHPDYNPDRVQKLISSSMSRHLSTRNISSKSMHAFLSNLANRQTNERGQTHLPPPLSDVISLARSRAMLPVVEHIAVTHSLSTSFEFTLFSRACLSSYYIKLSSHFKMAISSDVSDRKRNIG